MDTPLPLKIPFILDRNLAKANCTENRNRVCTSRDIAVLVLSVIILAIIAQIIQTINNYNGLP